MNNVGANSNIPDFTRVAQASASRVQSRANQAASKSTKSSSTPVSSSSVSSSINLSSSPAKNQTDDSFSNVLASSSDQIAAQANAQASSKGNDNQVSADSSNSLPTSSSGAANISAPKDNSTQTPVVPVGFSAPKPDKTDGNQVDDGKAQTQGEVQSARQMAMQVFLDRMQSEVGVSPDKLVEAFSKLSVQDLAEAPEDTADKLISELKLDPKNSKKAAGLYGEMLGMMAAAGMAQYLSNTNQQAQFHVMDKDQANLQNLRSNINTMSDKFFRTGPFTPAEPKAQQADQQNQILDANGQSIPAEMQPITNDRLGDAKAKAALAGLGGQAAAQAGVETEAASATAATTTPMGSPTVLQTLKAAQPGAQGSNAAQSQVSNPVMSTASIAAAAAAMNANVAAKAAAAENAAEDADGNEPINTKMNSLSADATGSAAAAAGATASGKILALDHAADGEAKSGKDDKDGEAELQGLQQPNHQAKNVAGGEKVFNVNTASASQAEMQANVKEIISQAQFLASKGGGEMKMSLTPEGLGQLSLKVKMVNGQLNVEMVTASDEAKKVLEKGLGELKDSLAVHKIHLDAIKIDTPKDLAGQMNQRQQEMEQGFQQRFLGDFRERNNSSRHEMFEFSGPSVPSSQTRDRAGNSSYAAASTKRKDARRLDLVA